MSRSPCGRRRSASRPDLCPAMKRTPYGAASAISAISAACRSTRSGSMTAPSSRQRSPTWRGAADRHSAPTTRSGCHGCRTRPWFWRRKAWFDMVGIRFKRPVRTDPGRALSPGARLVVAVPYLWLIGFFLVPFLIVLKISLSETAIALPPYTPVLDLSVGLQCVRDFIAALSLANYITLAGDELYILSYLKSLKVAAVSTVLLLACGIPLAYGMARAPRRLQPILLMLVVLPF